MSKLADTGASIARSIGNGISFADELLDDAKGFGGELATRAFMGVGKGATNAVDFAGDIAAGAVDLGSGVVSEITGKDLKTDLSNKKGFLDKAGDHLREGFDQIEDATRSKWGKTSLGENISDLAGGVGELAAPLGAMKGIKIAGKYASLIKNSPKAMSELKTAMEAAIKTGKKLDQLQVDEILKKYVPEMGEKLMKAPMKGMTAQGAKDLRKMISSYTPEQITGLAKKFPKIAGLIKGGATLTAATILKELTDKDLEEIAPSIEANAQEVEAPVEDGITIPPMDSKDPEVNKPDMTNAEIEPDTVDAKKKELELIKEKNAGKLNTATSVVDLMKALGVDSKQEARKIIFEKMTGAPYTGSAEDNIKLKALIEEAFTKGTIPEYFPSYKR